MSSLVASAADAAHSAAVSLLASSQIKPGDALPDIPVKEDDPTKTLTIHDAPGKVIIVCMMLS